MDYVVKYRSEGLLSGKEPGEKVTLTDALDAGKLLALGLIIEVARPDSEGGEDVQEPSKPTRRKHADTSADTDR